MAQGDRRQDDRRHDDPRVSELVSKMTGMEKVQAELVEQLARNTELTLSVSKNTEDIVAVWQAAKGGLHVLGWLGVIAKWVTVIAACAAAVATAIYAILHIGPPK